MKIGSYKDLDLWSKIIELVKNIYKETKNFPSDEKFGLVSQMRRAAVSIPSNIAEGFRRRYNNEYRQFLHTSLGSCAELETQVVIAAEIKYITKEIRDLILAELESISKMLISLIKKL